MEGWGKEEGGEGANPSHLETASINLPLVSHQRHPQVVSLTSAQSFPVCDSDGRRGRSEKRSGNEADVGAAAIRLMGIIAGFRGEIRIRN